jgi:hypothetical protein
MEILREDFRLARKAFDEASQRFDSVCTNPSPDSAQRSKIASRELDSARERLIEAVTRLNLFVTEGRVPDDLKRPPKK